MAWSTMNSRLATVPLIIAGPILRKIDDTSVSVWLAVNYNASDLSIKLEILNGSQVIMDGTLTNIIPLGTSLRVGVVTAKMQGITLSEGIVYKYNLTFSASNNVIGDLTTNGILFNNSYDVDISYDGSRLPSFSLAPDDINDLRVVHSSCRKPHGGVDDGKFDALVALDQMISDFATTANSRPHLLFLTGDQIYADDVADILLYMIQDAYPSFMGWEEPLPYTPSSNYDLHPGKRKAIRSASGFTSTDDKSHLVKLAEFYFMYLFAWSDVLWPSTQSSSNFPTYELMNNGVPSPTSRSDFDNEANLLFEFYKTLKLVRRGLANVPVYMMFDDHEVTDDWNINLEWYENIFGNGSNPARPLGIRIIQNALSAYAVFQAWGNTPDLFENNPDPNINPPGEPLMLALGNVGGYPDLNSHYWTDIANVLFPVLTQGSNSKYLSGGFPWHYSNKFTSSWQYVVLNTRTNREFFGNNGRAFAGLISTFSLATQISAVTQKNLLTFMVSPAPCFGSAAMEYLQGTIIKVPTQNVYGWDAEPWTFNQRSFENFLKALSEFDYILLLSGDVHYGYTRQIIYWNNRTTTQKITKIAQFVSSALKNETASTRTAFRVDKASRLLIPPAGTVDFIGFDNPGQHIKRNWLLGEYKVGNIETPAVYGYTVVAGIDYKMVSPSTPHWSYRVIPQSDTRTESQRGIDSKANLDEPYIHPAGTNLNMGEKHRRLEKWAKYNRVVGVNNISEIKLIWTSTDKIATQTLWFTPSGSANKLENLGGYTIHTVDLNETPTPRPED